MTTDNIELVITAEPIPLKADVDGVVRVSGTRVTLDSVVAAFREGATAEEIVLQYPSLDLASVYAVITYYLQRRPQVEAYLRQRQARVDEVQRQNEARFDPQGIRERLLARRAGQEAAGHATAGR
jgi:uncharacterized protein (DUF433 family)